MKTLKKINPLLCSDERLFLKIYIYQNYLILSEMCAWIISAGDFSYTEGISGWTDSSIGSQGWLHENSTSDGTNTLCHHNTQLLMNWYSVIKKNSKVFWHFVSFIFLRGVPVCGRGPGPAADRGPDTDPPPGPLRPSLHPQLWFCTDWKCNSRW